MESAKISLVLPPADRGRTSACPGRVRTSPSPSRTGTSPSPHRMRASASPHSTRASPSPNRIRASPSSNRKGTSPSPNRMRASVSPNRVRYSTSPKRSYGNQPNAIQLPSLPAKVHTRGTSQFLSVDREGKRPPLSPQSIERSRSPGRVSPRLNKVVSKKSEDERNQPTSPGTGTEATQGSNARHPPVLPPIPPSVDTQEEETYQVEHHSGEEPLQGGRALPQPSSSFQKAFSELSAPSPVFQNAASELVNTFKEDISVMSGGRESPSRYPGDLMIKRSSITSTLINMGSIPRFQSLLDPIKGGRGSIQAGIIDENKATGPLGRDGETTIPFNRESNRIPSMANSRMACRNFRRLEKQRQNRGRSSDTENNSRQSHKAAPKGGFSTNTSGNTTPSGEVRLAVDWSDLEDKLTKPLTYWRRAKTGISLRTIAEVTRLMSVASASIEAPGVSRRSNKLLASPRMDALTKERRESLRLIRQTLNAIKYDNEDLTEICNFEELRNCRYLRTKTIDGTDGQKNSLLGFNEI